MKLLNCLFVKKAGQVQSFQNEYPQMIFLRELFGVKRSGITGCFTKFSNGSKIL